MLALLPAGIVRAEDASLIDQTEWAQGYDADSRLSVPCSTTPVLSEATFARPEPQDAGTEDASLGGDSGDGERSGTF